MKWNNKASIFAFWIFGAWYLLIGGLLSQWFTVTEALGIIFVGNLVLVALFTFYAGNKKPKDQLFREAFGSHAGKYWITLLPAITQIGWCAVVIELGGNALATALSLVSDSWKNTPGLRTEVIILYGACTLWIAFGGLRRIGRVSRWCFLGMFLFSIWTLGRVVGDLGWAGIVSYQPADQSRSLSYGIQIIVASFISATVVAPDILHDLSDKRQVFLASFWGLIPATLLAGSLGILLAILGKDFNVITTLQLLSGSVPIYLFLSIDNLCGGQAIYPTGTGLASLWRTEKDWDYEFIRKASTAVCGVISIALAIYGVVGHIEVWLTILSMTLPPIIGVVLANQYLIKKDFSDKKVHLPALISWVGGCAVAAIPVGIPIIQAILISSGLFFILERLSIYNSKENSVATAKADL